jgi:serine/threonine-protein kinase
MAKYSSYILYLLVSILVVVLFANGMAPIDAMQRGLDDFLCNITASESKRPNVVIINIDNRAQDKFGEWPWNYDRVADLAAATASGEPSAIMLDFDLPENTHQDSAGHTEILAGQLHWIENAVLQYDIALANYRSAKTNNPEFLFKNSITTENRLGEMSEDASLLVRKIFMPAHKLLEHKPYLGFDYDAPDDDRVLRRQPLVMHYEGYYYPSQTLLTAAVHLGVSTSDIKVKENTTVELGSKRSIPIGAGSAFFTRFGKGSPFVSYSAADVLSDKFEHSKLKGKAVLIGVEDPRNTERFKTAVNDRMPSTWVKASVIENIINKNVVTPAQNSGMITMLILFFLGAVCAFVLPRVAMMHRFMILGGALIFLLNVNYFMVSSFGVIPQTAYIALQLLLFMIASPMLDSSLMSGTVSAPEASSKPKVDRRKPKQSDTVVGTADIPIRELKASPQDPENIDTRALDSLDKEQLDAGLEKTTSHEVEDHQAIDIDADADHAEDATSLHAGLDNSDQIPSEHIDEPAADEEEHTAVDHADLGEMEHDGDVDIPAVDESSPIPQVPTDIKNLGRYQVSEILGKGAMGMVYKGSDPAINRPVALKTIRLDFVNDPEEMAELKERLFREAQAAGKLSHPNIVTIYDVGSEGHLQYIAMEYLEGVTLETMIKKKTKFNYRIIAQIIVQICTALEYAHEQGIVHRDIKPANIMILKDYRVKVMDYGIARIDSNSMTKTGIAMGTPNYISPEQLKGLKIDRRADIFSLGVVMYEMLLGRRPFKGENITSLIYSIMNQEPEKPSNVNPRVPLLFDHVIMKALAKDQAARYQHASEIVTDLHEFVESFSVR